MSQHKQVEHIFRHEYGKLVAILTRRVSFQHIDLIEDSVQWSMSQALDLWVRTKIPHNPSAWLYKVAINYVLSELSSAQRKKALLIEHFSSEDDHYIEHKDIPFTNEMSDSMLRMLFATCVDDIPVESQIVFTLKSLCGFNIKEIALRLFISEANVYKRYSRAKNHLKTKVITFDNLSNDEMINRLASVHRVIYLVFTEGYLSSHTDIAIREDLCEEAIRLATLLVESNIGNISNSYALLAVMYFHLARIKSRQDKLGALLLLEQQNRSKWNQAQITLAMTFLAQSANGDAISQYHVEAGIAAEHCLAPSFTETRWEKIVTAYELLDRVAPSPLNILNKAIAIAEWKGPKAGVASFIDADIPTWLSHSYHWYTVKSDLLFRSGENSLGLKYATLAIDSAPTESIKQLLTTRLKKYTDNWEV